MCLRMLFFCCFTIYYFMSYFGLILSMEKFLEYLIVFAVFAIVRAIVFAATVLEAVVVVVSVEFYYFLQ